jgi:hypothetical protein
MTAQHWTLAPVVALPAAFGLETISSGGDGDVTTRLDSQVDQLTEAGCERVFTDKLSGKLAHRPKASDAIAGRRLVRIHTDPAGYSAGTRRPTGGGSGADALQEPTQEKSAAR